MIELKNLSLIKNYHMKQFVCRSFVTKNLKSTILVNQSMKQCHPKTGDTCKIPKIQLNKLQILFAKCFAHLYCAFVFILLKKKISFVKVTFI